jgi:hypothetical protein
LGALGGLENSLLDAAIIPARGITDPMSELHVAWFMRPAVRDRLDVINRC